MASSGRRGAAGNNNLTQGRGQNYNQRGLGFGYTQAWQQQTQNRSQQQKARGGQGPSSPQAQNQSQLQNPRSSPGPSSPQAQNQSQLQNPRNSPGPSSQSTQKKGAAHIQAAQPKHQTSPSSGNRPQAYQQQSSQTSWQVKQPNNQTKAPSFQHLGKGDGVRSPYIRVRLRTQNGQSVEVGVSLSQPLAQVLDLFEEKLKAPYYQYTIDGYNEPITNEQWEQITRKQSYNPLVINAIEVMKINVKYEATEESRTLVVPRKMDWTEVKELLEKKFCKADNVYKMVISERQGVEMDENVWEKLKGSFTSVNLVASEPTRFMRSFWSLFGRSPEKIHPLVQELARQLDNHKIDLERINDEIRKANHKDISEVDTILAQLVTLLEKNEEFWKYWLLLWFIVSELKISDYTSTHLKKVCQLIRRWMLRLTPEDLRILNTNKSCLPRYPIVIQAGISSNMMPGELLEETVKAMMLVVILDPRQRWWNKICILKHNSSHKELLTIALQLQRQFALKDLITLKDLAMYVSSISCKLSIQEIWELVLKYEIIPEAEKMADQFVVEIASNCIQLEDVFDLVCSHVSGKGATLLLNLAKTRCSFDSVLSLLRSEFGKIRFHEWSRPIYDFLTTHKCDVLSNLGSFNALLELCPKEFAHELIVALVSGNVDNNRVILQKPNEISNLLKLAPSSVETEKLLRFGASLIQYKNTVEGVAGFFYAISPIADREPDRTFSTWHQKLPELDLSVPLRSLNSLRTLLRSVKPSIKCDSLLLQLWQAFVERFYTVQMAEATTTYDILHGLIEGIGSNDEESLSFAILLIKFFRNALDCAEPSEDLRKHCSLYSYLRDILKKEETMASSPLWIKPVVELVNRFGEWILQFNSANVPRSAIPSTTALQRAYQEIFHSLGLCIPFQWQEALQSEQEELSALQNVIGILNWLQERHVTTIEEQSISKTLSHLTYILTDMCRTVTNVREIRMIHEGILHNSLQNQYKFISYFATHKCELVNNLVRPKNHHDISNLCEMTESVCNLLMEFLTGEISVEKLRKVLPLLSQVDVEKEIGIIRTFFQGVEVNPQVVAGITQSMELLKAASVIIDLLRTIVQYQLLPEDHVDYVEMKRITQGSLRMPLNAIVNNSQYRTFGEMLDGLQSSHLALFTIARTCGTLVGWLKDTKLHTLSGLQRLGSIQTQLNTALRGRQFEQELLQSLFRAIDYITPFIPEKPYNSLKDFLTAVRACNLTNDISQLEHLKVVNREIAVIQQLIHEGESTNFENAMMRRERVLESGSVHIEANRTSRNHEVESKLQYKPVKNGDRVIILSNEEITELVRQVTFSVYGMNKVQKKEAQHEDSRRALLFLELMSVISAIKTVISELACCGHPDYQFYISRTFILSSLQQDTVENAKEYLQELICSKQEWNDQLEELTDEFPHLLHFNPQELASLVLLMRNGSIRNKFLDMMVGGGTWKKTSSATALSRELVQSFLQATHAIGPDGDEKLKSVADTLVTDTGEVRNLPRQFARVSESLFSLTKPQVGRQGQIYRTELSKKTPTEFFQHILQPFIDENRLPLPFEILWVNETTPYQEVHFFFKRVKLYHQYRFLLIGVNYVNSELICSELRELENKRHAFLLLASVDSTCPVVYAHFPNQTITVPIKTLKETLRKLVTRNSPELEVQLLIGEQACGKTHVARKQLAIAEKQGGNSVILPINDILDSGRYLQRFNFLLFTGTIRPPKPITTFVNVSAHALQTEDLSTSEYERDIANSPIGCSAISVNRFLLELFLHRTISATQNGCRSFLPTKLTCRFFVEAPALLGKGKKPEQFLPVLDWTANFQRIENGSLCRTFDISDEAREVAMYLKSALKPIAFGNDEAVREEIKQWVPPIISSQTLLQAWIKAMYHRCKYFKKIYFQETSKQYGSFPEVVRTIFLQNVRWINTQSLKLDWGSFVRDCGSILLFDSDGMHGCLHAGSLPEKLQIVLEEQEKFLNNLAVKRILSCPEYEGVSRNECLLAMIMGFTGGSGAKLVKRVLRSRRFVLSEEILLRFWFVLEKRKAGLPLVIESGTGVGKTYLLETIAELELEQISTQANMADTRIAPLVGRRFCHLLVIVINLLLKVKPDLNEEIKKKMLKDLASAEVANLEGYNEFGYPLEDKAQRYAEIIRIWKFLVDNWPQDKPVVETVMKILEGTLMGSKLKEHITNLTALDNAPEAGEENEQHPLGILLHRYISDKLLSTYPLLRLPETLAREMSNMKLDIDCSKELMERFLIEYQIQNTVFKLLIHPGLDAQDITKFMEPIIELASSLPDFIFTVFFDEFNTATTLGFLKCLVVDRMLHADKIPENIFFCAAINPRKDGYLVHDLPPAMEAMKCVFTPMTEQDTQLYIEHKLAMIMEDAGMRFQVATVMQSTFVQMIVECQQHLLAIHGHSVSQRDIQRVFTVFRCVKRWYDPDNETKLANTTTDQIINSLVLSIGYGYFLRLEGEQREKLDSKLTKILTKILPLPTKVNFGEHLCKCIQLITKPEHFEIPNGIALNQALRENIVATLIAIDSKVPIAIVGKPGSSKTLSFQIISNNLQGENSPKSFIRQLRFPRVDPFYIQGSKSSTAKMIADIFDMAIARENSFLEVKSNARAVVFFDEASLPSKSMALKVLHPYLDDCKAAFVCISNETFDPANQNRMLTVLRLQSTESDLLILAYGCLGVKEEEVSEILKKQIIGLCHAFSYVIEDKELQKKFHYRDFIYMLRQLNRRCNLKVTRMIQPLELLRSLEENFNGVETSIFGNIVEIFFCNIIAEGLGSEEFEVPCKRLWRSTINILKESLSQNINGYGVDIEIQLRPRFKMIIDPSNDNSAARILQQLSLIPKKVHVIQLSDLIADATEVGDAQRVSEIRSCMEQGETVVLINGDRIYGNLYDLLNQNYRIGPSGEFYSNVAIGSETHQCSVLPEFQCIVVVPLRQVCNLPAPLLSRFEKYILGIWDVYNMQLEKYDFKTQQTICMFYDRCKNFVETIGSEMFVGYEEKSTLPSLFLRRMTCSSESQNLSISEFLQYNENFQKAHQIIARQSFTEHQRVVMSLCVELIQLLPPQALFIGLKKMRSARLYTQIYLEGQEHFSLRALLQHIMSKQTDVSEVVASHQAQLSVRLSNKWTVYTTRGMDTQRLRVSFLEMVEGDVQLAEQVCVFPVEAIECKQQMMQTLDCFVNNSTLKVCLLISDARNARTRVHLTDKEAGRQSSIIELLRHLVDDIEARGKLKHKAVIIIQQLDPEMVFGGTAPPHVALLNWEAVYLDCFVSSAIVKCLASSLCVNDPHQLVNVKYDSIDELVWEFCRRVVPDWEQTAPKNLPEDIAIFYEPKSTLSNRSQVLKQVLSRYPVIVQTLMQSFSSQKKISLIRRELEQIATESLTGKRPGSFSRAIIQTQSSAMYRATFLRLQEICNDHGLGGLVAADWSDQLDSFILAAMNMLPKEPLTNEPGLISLRLNLFKWIRVPFGNVLFTKLRTFVTNTVCKTGDNALTFLANLALRNPQFQAINLSMSNLEREVLNRLHRLYAEDVIRNALQPFFNQSTIDNIMHTLLKFTELVTVQEDQNIQLLLRPHFVCIKQINELLKVASITAATNMLCNSTIQVENKRDLQKSFTKALCQQLFNTLWNVLQEFVDAERQQQVESFKQRLTTNWQSSFVLAMKNIPLNEVANDADYEDWVEKIAIMHVSSLILQQDLPTLHKIKSIANLVTKVQQNGECLLQRLICYAVTSLEEVGNDGEENEIVAHAEGCLVLEILIYFLETAVADSFDAETTKYVMKLLNSTEKYCCLIHNMARVEVLKRIKDCLADEESFFDFIANELGVRHRALLPQHPCFLPMLAATVDRSRNNELFSQPLCDALFSVLSRPDDNLSNFNLVSSHVLSVTRIPSGRHAGEQLVGAIRKAALERDAVVALALEFSRIPNEYFETVKAFSAEVLVPNIHYQLLFLNTLASKSGDAQVAVILTLPVAANLGDWSVPFKVPATGREKAKPLDLCFAMPSFVLGTEDSDPQLRSKYVQVSELVDNTITQGNDQRLLTYAKSCCATKPERQDLKMMVLLKIYYDFWCTNKCHLVRQLSASLQAVAELNWEPLELQALSLCTNPKLHLDQLHEEINEAQGSVAELVGLEPDRPLQTVHIRHMIINLLALIIGCPSKDHHLLCNISEPQQVVSTLPFASFYDYVVGNVHYDCGCQITADGLPATNVRAGYVFDFLGIHVSFAVVFGSWLLHMLLMPKGSGARLCPPVIAAHALDSQFAGSTVANSHVNKKLVLFLLAHVQMSFAHMQSETNNNDTALLLITRVLEAYRLHASAAPYCRTYSTLASRLLAEENFSRIISFKQRNLANSRSDVIKACVGLEAYQKLVEFSATAYKSDAEVGIPQLDSWVRTQTDKQQQQPSDIIVAFVSKQNIFHTLPLCANICKMYTTLHTTCANLVGEHELEQVTLESLIRRLEENQPRNRPTKTQETLEAGVVAFNKYHAAVGGQIDGGMCQEGRGVFSTISPASAVIHLLSLPHGKEGSDLLYLAIQTLVKSYNEFWQACASTVHNCERLMWAQAILGSSVQVAMRVMADQSSGVLAATFGQNIESMLKLMAYENHKVESRSLKFITDVVARFILRKVVLGFGLLQFDREKYLYAPRVAVDEQKAGGICDLPKALQQTISDEQKFELAKFLELLEPESIKVALEVMLQVGSSIESELSGKVPAVVQQIADGIAAKPLLEVITERTLRDLNTVELIIRNYKFSGAHLESVINLLQAALSKLEGDKGLFELLFGKISPSLKQNVSDSSSMKIIALLDEQQRKHTENNTLRHYVQCLNSSISNLQSLRDYTGPLEVTIIQALSIYGVDDDELLSELPADIFVGNFAHVCLRLICRRNLVFAEVIESEQNDDHVGTWVELPAELPEEPVQQEQHFGNFQTLESELIQENVDEQYEERFDNFRELAEDVLPNIEVNLDFNRDTDDEPGAEKQILLDSTLLNAEDMQYVPESLPTEMRNQPVVDENLRDAQTNVYIVNETNTEQTFEDVDVYPHNYQFAEKEGDEFLEDGGQSEMIINDEQYVQLDNDEEVNNVTSLQTMNDEQFGQLDKDEELNNVTSRQMMNDEQFEQLDKDTGLPDFDDAEERQGDISKDIVCETTVSKFTEPLSVSQHLRDQLVTALKEMDTQPNIVSYRFTSDSTYQKRRMDASFKLGQILSLPAVKSKRIQKPSLITPCLVMANNSSRVVIIVERDDIIKVSVTVQSETFKVLMAKWAPVLFVCQHVLTELRKSRAVVQDVSQLVLHLPSGQILMADQTLDSLRNNTDQELCLRCFIQGPNVSLVEIQYDEKLIPEKSCLMLPHEPLIKLKQQLLSVLPPFVVNDVDISDLMCIDHDSCNSIGECLGALSSVTLKFARSSRLRKIQVRLGADDFNVETTVFQSNTVGELLSKVLSEVKYHEELNIPSTWRLMVNETAHRLDSTLGSITRSCSIEKISLVRVFAINMAWNQPHKIVYCTEKKQSYDKLISTIEEQLAESIPIDHRLVDVCTLRAIPLDDPVDWVQLPERLVFVPSTSVVSVVIHNNIGFEATIEMEFAVYAHIRHVFSALSKYNPDWFESVEPDQTVLSLGSCALSETHVISGLCSVIVKKQGNETNNSTETNWDAFGEEETPSELVVNEESSLVPPLENEDQNMVSQRFEESQSMEDWETNVENVSSDQKFWPVVVLNLFERTSCIPLRIQLPEGWNNSIAEIPCRDNVIAENVVQVLCAEHGQLSEHYELYSIKEDAGLFGTQQLFEITSLDSSGDSVLFQLKLGEEITTITVHCGLNSVQVPTRQHEFIWQVVCAACTQMGLSVGNFEARFYNNDDGPIILPPTCTIDELTEFSFTTSLFEQNCEENDSDQT